MKKIAIDAREIVKNKNTGTKRFLLLLLSCPDLKKEFDIVLFGNQYTDFENEILKDYKKIVIKENFVLFYDQISLPKFLKKEKVDMYFSPYYKMPLFTDIKCAITIFDLTYLLVKPYKDYLSNKIYRKNFLKKSLFASCAIFTSSNNTKKDILSLFKLKEDKIKTVYLPLADMFYDIPKIDREKENYIFYLSNHLPHKNLNTLLKAYGNLPQEIKKKYKLVISGVPENFIKEKNPYIECLGQVEDRELIKLYMKASLFVFPSLYEGFGYPPLEALACGCPVLSSNAACMPEILGSAAVYFNPYDSDELSMKIIELLNDKDRLDFMSEAGFKRAKFYDKQKFYKGIMDFFRE
jgi:glycosyltransferase involved in cell wall biosynthesis